MAKFPKDTWMCWVPNEEDQGGEESGLREVGAPDETDNISSAIERVRMPEMKWGEDEGRQMW